MYVMKLNNEFDLLSCGSPKRGSVFSSVADLCFVAVLALYCLMESNWCRALKSVFISMCVFSQKTASSQLDIVFNPRDF